MLGLTAARCYGFDLDALAPIARRIGPTPEDFGQDPTIRTDPEEVRRRGAKALILSGGPRSVYEPGAPALDVRLLGLGIPVLGLCYGQQAMAQVLGGTVVQLGANPAQEALVQGGHTAGSAAYTLVQLPGAPPHAADVAQAAGVAGAAVVSAAFPRAPEDVAREADVLRQQILAARNKIALLAKK